MKENKESIERKPSLEKGNYYIYITSNGKIIKKVVAINSDIYIDRLSDEEGTIIDF